jgi:CelD/BcsL family acetyltransferase involved in cellulose biosynthesis
VRHRFITVRELSAGDERSWRELGARAVEPNPFYEPDCVIPAALHLAYGAEIGLVVAEDDGRFMACIPFRCTSRWKMRYPVVTSQVRRMNYLGTPLVDGSAGVGAVAALMAGLAERRRPGRGRILVLEAVAGDGPVAGLLRAAASQLSYPLSEIDSYERGLLRRKPDASYERIHSSKARYNLRRQRRQLSEHCGGSEVTLVERTNDPSAIDDYIALEASGYKARTGVAMTTVPGEPEYFTDMCKRFSAAGRLHVLALEAGGRTVAMEIWVRGGGGLFLIKISYDEECARFGPGVLLQISAMQHFHDHTDAQWIDTCTSEHNEILLRLYPERRKVEALCVVLGRNAIDRTAVRAFMAARPLHRRYYQWRHPEHVPMGTGHP